MLNETKGYLDPPRGMDRAVRNLARRVERALRGVQRDERLLGISEPVEGVEPLLWLRGQTTSPKTYWTGRDGCFETAAVGAADAVRPTDFDGFLALRNLLSRTDGNVRYYGGVRFDPRREASEEWSPFGAYAFVLPRFELAVENGVRRLACNLVLPRDFGKRVEILADLCALRSGFGDEPAERSLPRFAGREDRPAFDGWRENVERSLRTFASGELKKVVLARRAGLRFAEDLDAGEVLHNLRSRTPGCFHFYFEPPGEPSGGAFLGASPERLYRRDGRALRSEAVAGTRPRGASVLDDDELRDELLGSPKDRDEHRFVRESIREDLGALCESLKAEEGSSEMKLATRRHLVSRFRGTLREGVSDADVLEVLHPTPAVGGYPKTEARRRIEEMEPFDRGWYAGPVGWISAGAAEFAVGIRSALTRENELALFSGAGIVAGSTPEGEWAEIEQKVSDFAAVLGLGGSSGAPLERNAG